MGDKPMKILVYMLIAIIIGIVLIFMYPVKYIAMNVSEYEIATKYKEWESKNTGTYTYIYENDQRRVYLVWMKNNKMVQYIVPESSMHFSNTAPIKKYSFPFNFFKINKTFNIRRNSSYLYKLSNYKASLTFDPKYSFISKIQFMNNNKRMSTHYGNRKDIYNYALLMLPPDTNFTSNVMDKIVNKYRQAIECGLKKKYPLNYQYFSNHDIYIVRDERECFEKYLTWEDN